MNLRAVLHRSAIAALLALAACTGSPRASALMDADSQLPEPARPAASTAPREQAMTGLTLAIASGATQLYVIDMDRVRITHPQGTAGGAEADTAATVAKVRDVLAGVRFWAEDGVLLLDGPAPFAGRARAQTRGVLRFSLSPRAAGGSAIGGLTAEVRGEEIVGRVSRHSAAGETPAWTHGAFFRAPLRRVPPRDWPPRAPRALSAEPLADGGVLLRWIVPRNTPPDAEYIVYRLDDTAVAATEVGVTKKTQYAAPAAGGRDASASAAWYVVTRSPAGEVSSPSPSATID